MSPANKNHTQQIYMQTTNKRFQSDAKTSAFCVTRCAQTLTQKHSDFGAAEAGVRCKEHE